MSEKHKRFTITAALPYTNGPIHIGHLAGVYLPADIFSRFQRIKGHDVAFICGSDEHGAAISIRAKKEGKTPQEIIDKYHQIIEQSFKDFGITFDNYSRTSKAIHHQTASEFFQKLYQDNKFIEQTTNQLYDHSANQFLADRFVVGTCPKCSNDQAYGDQCEACGSTLNATDLINPKSSITGNVPKLKQTKHWFLPLDRYEKFLREWVLIGHKSDWKSNVYGQVKSWLDEGLKPRAVTRDLDWGIPVPIQAAQGKVLYVWFDAPIGYISSTKEWAKNNNKDWKPYWQDNSTKLIHFIGKDNIVFHCIIFPSMLKAHGDFILPENVPSNEFLNLEGQKLSTSKNWAVWLDEYLKDFPNKQDVLRYTLTSIAPETKDSDFTWKDFQNKNNNELAAIYGNFINRVIVLTQKYYQSKVPSPKLLTDQDKLVIEKLKAYPSIIADSINKYRFREAQSELMNVARLGNKYLADQEPWKIIKTDPGRVKTQMYLALQIASVLAILSEPFLPFTSKKVTNLLGINKLPSWDHLNGEIEVLPPDTSISKSKPSVLFEKIEDHLINQQIEKLKQTKNTKELKPQKDLVSFEDFTKLDIRTARIIGAKKHPKADKLLVLEVDTGIDTRTIVSGIANDYNPKDLIDRKVTVLVNLTPRKLRGIESQGMVLMTEDEQGKLQFVHSEGSKVGLVIS